MKLGILSDSHGAAATTERAVGLLREAGADLLVHLGDIGSEAVLDVLAGGDARIVFGNCDWNDQALTKHARALGVGVDHPAGEIDIEGKSIVFTHGHMAAPMHAALARGADYLLHGHSHVLRDDQLGPTRVINPGALSRASRYTAAILEPGRDVLLVIEVPRGTLTMTDADFDISRLRIELARDADHLDLLGLYRQSLLEGQLRGNDTGADIEKLNDAYFADDGASGFWVARYGDEIVGMIGVQKTAENQAEIRRLRVDSDFRRRGIGTQLMQQAVAFCREHGYLKVALDVRVERGPAIAMFEKFGFAHWGVRDIDGHKLLDFYLDLYRDTSR